MPSQVVPRSASQAGPAVKRSAPKANDMTMISPTCLKNNFQALSFLRNFVAVIVGIAVGILGVTGWHGFIYHFASQLLCAAAMVLKGCTSPPAFFLTWSNLLTVQTFSSVTLLSYILFWMIFYNLCHVF